MADKQKIPNKRECGTNNNSQHTYECATQEGCVQEGFRKQLGIEGRKFLERMFIKAYDRELCGFGVYDEPDNVLISRMRERYEAWFAAAKACEQVFGIDLNLLTDTIDVVKEKHEQCMKKRMELKESGGDPKVLSQCDKNEKEFVELTHGLMRAQSNGYDQKLYKYKELTAARAACMDTLGAAIEAAVTSGDGVTVGGAASKIQSILNEIAGIDIERANYLADLFSEVTW